MSDLKAAAEAWAGLQYRNSNPTWKEYEAESPAGKRAIIARWFEIKSSQPNSLAEFADWGAALGRWGRAQEQNPPRRPDNWWHEDFLQGDYDRVDSRQRYELGE